MDFRPKKAKQPIGSAAPKKAAEKRPTAPAPAAAEVEAEAGPAAEDEGETAAASNKALPARTWNFGAGPRPEGGSIRLERQAVPLLGPDEPACWHEALAALPPLGASPAPDADPAAAERASARALEDARAALAAAADAAERRAGPDARWLSTVRKSGTTSDRLAAWTLLVQEWPVGNLRSLDALLAMAESKAKRQAAQAVDSLRELFAGSLLPTRKVTIHSFAFL